jgi:hypothetical protein
MLFVLLLMLFLLIFFLIFLLLLLLPERDRAALAAVVVHAVEGDPLGPAQVQRVAAGEGVDGELQAALPRPLPLRRQRVQHRDELLRWEELDVVALQF